MRVPRKRIAELIALVSRREGAHVAEVDVAVVDRREISRLNRRWLGHAGATVGYMIVAVPLLGG